MVDFMQHQWVIMAVVLALGVIGLVALQTLLIPQQAEAAGCLSSLPHSAGGIIGFNASAARCYHG